MNWNNVLTISKGKLNLDVFFFIFSSLLLKLLFCYCFRLGGEVSKVFPDILLATMEIIHLQYKNLKGRDGYTFNTDETKERVR